MSIEEIIKRLEALAETQYNFGNLLRDPEKSKHWLENYDALEEAIALLRTHPEAQPNEPLTLEELREMKGDPVWLKCGLKVGEWAVALGREDFHYMYFTAWRGYMRFPIEDYGTVWLAYRRPPKEET